MNYIIKRIKALIDENRNFHRGNYLLNKEIESQNKELLWSQIYHDSIRGIKYFEDLSLNVGRWAGNYSFFYVLSRILLDTRPYSILELGLGESSKMVAAYINNEEAQTQHLIVEHDCEWKNNFLARVSMAKTTEILICELEQKKIHGNLVNVYASFEEKVNNKFDLYIIDGPFGSARFSRYDIIFLAEKFQYNQEFVLLFDDYDRIGEKDTVAELFKVLTNKDITFYKQVYSGQKDVLLVGTEKYKYLTSM